MSCTSSMARRLRLGDRRILEQFGDRTKNECRVAAFGNRFSREQNEGIESLADSWSA